MLTDRDWKLDHLLQAAGWDFERAVFVKDMAKLRKEPLSSMGHDRVLTVFGGRITAELPGEAADEATLLRAMHGLVEDEAVA